MEPLLKKSDRVILIVGLLVGGIALSWPLVEDFIQSVLFEDDLRKVNEQTIELQGVEVKLPRTRDPEPAGRVKLNEADRGELEDLPGIGPVLAKRIVELRRNVGGFDSLEEIKQVEGIGPATVEQLREQLEVGG